MIYGRSERDWDTLETSGGQFLEERARLGLTTSYTEMNTVLIRRTGLIGFDFDREEERAAMGYLLGRISRAMYDDVGALMSSLVQYLNENDAGPGFFALAHDLGILPSGANSDDRLAFWATQVATVHDHFAGRRRRARPRGAGTSEAGR